LFDFRDQLVVDAKARGCEEISSRWETLERRRVQRPERESCGGAGQSEREGPGKILALFVFSDFVQLCFLKILIYARVLHRPSARGTEMAVRTETSQPGGSAPEFASLAASSWSDCPHACRHDGG
jgi:hypothetical protein